MKLATELGLEPGTLVWNVGVPSGVSAGTAHLSSLSVLFSDTRPGHVFSCCSLLLRSDAPGLLCFLSSPLQPPYHCTPQMCLPSYESDCNCLLLHAGTCAPQGRLPCPLSIQESQGPGIVVDLLLAVAEWIHKDFF